MLKSITKIRTIECASAHISLRNDGIIEVVLKSNIMITVAMLKEQAAVFEALGEGKKFPVLYIAGKYTLIESDARSYSASFEANRFTLANAFVLASTAQKLIGNVYLKIDKPCTPTKMFNSEQDAVNWLYQFNKLN